MTQLNILKLLKLRISNFNYRTVDYGPHRRFLQSA